MPAGQLKVLIMTGLRSHAFHSSKSAYGPISSNPLIDYSRQCFEKTVPMADNIMMLGQWWAGVSANLLSIRTFVHTAWQPTQGEPEQSESCLNHNRLQTAD